MGVGGVVRGRAIPRPHEVSSKICLSSSRAFSSVSFDSLSNFTQF